jgi:hypothetical protein
MIAQAEQAASNTAMKAYLPALLACGVLVAHSAAQSPALADTSKALRSTLGKNAAHARDWLDQKDFKSLAQSSGGLLLLTQLLKAKSDDPAWQAAMTNIGAAVADLQAGSRVEDSAKCTAALAALDKSIAAAESLSPAGKPLPAPRGPGIRPLMLTMDGVYADAKIALLSGNVASAKNQALVLSELGQLVSNSRTGEPWATRAAAFQDAATDAATSPETETAKVRQLLRGISQRCDACHEMRTAPR